MTNPTLKSPNRPAYGTKLDDNYFADDNWPLIPEGIYTAQCVSCEKGLSHHNSLKLFLHFNIVEGQHFGKELFMAINLVDCRTGKEYKNIPSGSKYNKSWVIANNNKLPSRGDRMSSKIFKDRIFKVQVKTVKRKFPNGMEMPECFHYSKVDYLIERVA